MIDAAEDRERFQKLLHELKLRQPPNATARTEAEALEKAQQLGYPLVVRPSYVLAAARWKSCTSSATWNATCARR